MVFFLFPFSPSRLVSFAIIIIIFFFFFFFVIFFRFFFSRSHCPASSSPLNCCSAACASPGNKMQARTDRHPDPALWIDGWGDAERDGTRRDADDGRTDGQTDRRRGACTTRARARHDIRPGCAARPGHHFRFPFHVLPRVALLSSRLVPSLLPLPAPPCCLLLTPLRCSAPLHCTSPHPIPTHLHTRRLSVSVASILVCFQPPDRFSARLPFAAFQLFVCLFVLFGARATILSV
ncbi:hypothetical protein BKA80DRAFT_24262 [Phyllosticta citrichinensis]